MRIKMKSTAAGPQGVFQADQEVVVSDELGQSFVDGDYAVEVKGTPLAGGHAVEEKAMVSATPKATTKKKSGKREKATRKPPETATIPEPTDTEVAA